MLMRKVLPRARRAGAIARFIPCRGATEDRYLAQ
jgi:hypothetical protein